MLEGKNLKPNDFSILQACRGETILAILTVPSRIPGLPARPKDWLIVFHSGYSLQVHYSRAYWFNNTDETKRELQKEIERRQINVEDLQDAQEVLEKLEA